MQTFQPEAFVADVGNTTISEPQGGARLPVSKIVFDKVFAAAALVLSLPVLVVIACAIALTFRGPVLFRHTRIGLNGKPFFCLKFRTMVPDADARLQDLLNADQAARQEWEQEHKLRHDPRVTPLGRFLRRSSLDELPQFWNVLRGDMSIVGPRPITRDEAPKYAEQFAVYSSVRPGITGVWQVSGRSDTGFPERVSMDVEYVQNWSLWRDVVLAWRTLSVIVSAVGAR